MFSKFHLLCNLSSLPCLRVCLGMLFFTFHVTREKTRICILKYLSIKSKSFKSEFYINSALFRKLMNFVRTSEDELSDFTGIPFIVFAVGSVFC